MSIPTTARRRLLTAAAAIVVAGLPVGAQAHPAHRMARQQRAAASVSTTVANAMQAAIAAHGSSNAVLASYRDESSTPASTFAWCSVNSRAGRGGSGSSRSRRRRS